MIEHVAFVESVMSHEVVYYVMVEAASQLSDTMSIDWYRSAPRLVPQNC